VLCGIIGMFLPREGKWMTDSGRITIHNASWDYEGGEERHGTRVTSLAEVPYFDEEAPTRREALGLRDD
jgi:hypothetical protein